MGKKPDQAPYQHALITGGSSGIGFALAKQLAVSGASVAILGRRIDQLNQALDALQSVKIHDSQRFTAIQADVSKRDEIKSILAGYLADHGTPDLLINSAGVTHPGNFEDLAAEVFEQMISINYLGTVYTIQAILPGMISRGSGTIINISSVAGFIGVYGYSAYGGSKYAVRGLSDVLRAEMKPKGIQVSVVFPPDTQTPQLEYENTIKPAMTRELSGTAGILSAETVAQAILSGAKKGKYIIIPGRESKLIYFVNQILGNGMYSIMDWQIRSASRKIEKRSKSS